MNMLEKDKALRFEDIMQDEKDGRQPSWYYIYSTDDIDQGIFLRVNEVRNSCQTSMTPFLSFSCVHKLLFRNLQR